jgi:hypothetical protein
MAMLCPHCGQRMLMRHGVLLSPKLADIFDVIERRGRAGIFAEVLAWVVYGTSSTRTRKALAVNISHLNDRLIEASIRIAADRYGPYRIIKLKQRARAA